MGQFCRARVGQFCRALKLMQYPESLATTWKATFERLSLGAQAILSLLAFLAPDPIPESLLEKGAAVVERALSVLSGDSLRPEERVPVPSILGELAAFSMVNRRRGDVIVHPLVQEVVRQWYLGPKATDWVSISLDLIAVSIPRDAEAVSNWPVWDALRPHVTKVVANAENLGIGHPTASLMSTLGIFLRAHGLFGEAEQLFRRALALAEGSTDERLVASLPLFLNNLAECLEDTDQRGEAEELIRRALALDLRIHGPDHLRLTVHLNNLAQLVRANPERAREAEPLLQRALAICRSRLGNEHAQTAVHLANLGGLLKELHRYVEAESLLREALEIDRTVLGSEHPEVATDLNLVASFLRDCGRLGEAEQMLRNALSIDVNYFGPEHLSVARDWRSLGNLLRVKGRFLEAGTALKKALAILEATLGRDHSRAQEVQSDLSNLEQEIGASSTLSTPSLPFEEGEA